MIYSEFGVFGRHRVKNIKTHGISSLTQPHPCSYRTISMVALYILQGELAHRLGGACFQLRTVHIRGVGRSGDVILEKRVFLK